jgi:hypothetical protein
MHSDAQQCCHNCHLVLNNRKTGHFHHMPLLTITMQNNSIIQFTQFPEHRPLRYCKGRTIAQAVSRWLPTVVVWVQTRVWSSGICGGQSGTGAGVLLVLQFPLPIFIPPIAPQSPPSIIWGSYNRPEVAAVQGT